MKNITLNLTFATAICMSMGKFSSALANDFILDDAERFAKLFTLKSEVSEERLKREYLNLGTKGLEIFTPDRIENEKNLLRAISENPEIYKKGIDVCLPAARLIENESRQILDDVKNFLNQEKSASTYILFGANNSGGTASHEGLSIGLEVMCRLSKTDEDVNEILLAFIAHEIVHVYQAREFQNKEIKHTLLRQALVEGFPDFVTNHVLGKITKPEIKRHSFGLKNEGIIWKDFKAVMNGVKLKPWMYGSGGEGRPSDLGYWIGKRIAEAYYEKSEDKTKALEELLYLKDPQSILQFSGYDPK